MTMLPVLDGIVVSDPAPLGASGFRWCMETRGTTTGYFALVRGWRLSVFVNRHNRYHCLVENVDIDSYNFLFASSGDAARLLAHLLAEQECDLDDCLRRALAILQSDTPNIHKYLAVTDIAYEIVKGHATAASRRGLAIVLHVTNDQLLRKDSEPWD